MENQKGFKWGGVGEMMGISYHIWAFQRSQGKVIFHIDGRRCEMDRGNVAYHSDEVGRFRGPGGRH